MASDPDSENGGELRGSAIRLADGRAIEYAPEENVLSRLLADLSAKFRTPPEATEGWTRRKDEPRFHAYTSENEMLMLYREGFRSWRVDVERSGGTQTLIKNVPWSHASAAVEAYLTVSPSNRVSA